MTLLTRCQCTETGWELWVFLSHISLDGSSNIRRTDWLDISIPLLNENCAFRFTTFPCLAGWKYKYWLSWCHYTVIGWDLCISLYHISLYGKSNIRRTGWPGVSILLLGEKWVLRWTTCSCFAVWKYKYWLAQCQYTVTGCDLCFVVPLFLAW